MNEDIIRFSIQLQNKAVAAAQAAGGVVELPMSFYLARGASYVVPNLGAFNETVNQAVYRESVHIWPGTLLYGVVYTAGILGLSILIFMRRNFK